MSRSSPVTSLVGGGLVVAILDGLDALIFFGLRGVAPERIFQSIAAGLLGPAAFQGGWRTTALGVALHFFIALLIVVVCYLLSRFVPLLIRRPYLAGALYGLVAYTVMNYVVIPLSASGGGGGWPAWPVLLNGLLIHVFGVGIPSALFVRAAVRHRRARLEQRG